MNNLRQNMTGLALAAVTGTCAGNAAVAEQLYANTEVQLHYGEGYHLGRNGFDPTARTIVTFEHYGLHDWGDYLAFVDLNKDHDGPSTGRETDHYAEMYAHLNGNKLGLTFGERDMVRDFGPEIGLRHGTDYLVALYGVRADLNVRGFDYVNLGIYAFNNIVDPYGLDLDTTYSASLTWSAPFEVGSQKFSTQGYLEFIGDQGSGVDQQLTFSPQIRWDIGHVAGGEAGKFDLGFEYTYWRNVYGVTGVDDNSLSVFLATKF